jgi:hypothetical protein
MNIIVNYFCRSPRANTPPILEEDIHTPPTTEEDVASSKSADSFFDEPLEFPIRPPTPPISPTSHTLKNLELVMNYVILWKMKRKFKICVK